MSRPLNTTLQDRIKVLEQQLREAQNTVLRLQASRTPIKWPTDEEVLIGADEKIVGIYGYGPYGDDVQVYRRAWVECFEWLKSFIEEGRGNE